MKSRLIEVTLIGTHSIQLPESEVVPFLKAGQKRVRVEATYDGRTLSFHAAIQKRKQGFYLMFSKQKQKKLGIFPNDIFQLRLFKNETEYGVEMPEELQAVLASDPEGFDVFKSLTDGKKRGVIYTIKRYRNSQTRIDKSLLLCDNLKRGIRDARMLFKSF